MRERSPAKSVDVAALQQALASGADDNHVDDSAMAAYLGGSLARDAREALERHAAACARCGEDLAQAACVERDAETHDRIARRAPAAQAKTPNRPAVARSPGTTTIPAWMRLAAAVALALAGLLGARQAANLVAGRLEPVLVARAEQWAQRRVETGDVSLLLAGGPGLELSGLAVADDPSFSEADFFSARSVALHVEPSALLEGRLAGRVEIDQPVLRLVRDRAGRWNVQTLGGARAQPGSLAGALAEEADRALAEAAREKAPSDAGGGARVELASASIHDGVLEIEELGSDGTTLRLEAVDLLYSGEPGQRGTVSLEGHIGPDRDRVALRGEVGPFDGDVTPVYRFPEVALRNVPVRGLPGAPRAVLGEITFGGHLESAGRSLAKIAAAARGGGTLELCCGAFEGRNLARELVTHLAALPGGERLLEAVARQAAVASALQAPDTLFDAVSAIADLEPSTLHLTALDVRTPLLRVDADTSLTLAGHLEAGGTVEVGPELGRVLLAALPALEILEDDAGRLLVPFSASGRWPDLRLEVDAEAVVAAVKRRQRLSPPRMLAGWLRSLS